MWGTQVIPSVQVDMSLILMVSDRRRGKEWLLRQVGVFASLLIINLGINNEYPYFATDVNKFKTV